MRAAHAWIDELSFETLRALIVCCELPAPQPLTRDSALRALRGTDEGRSRIQSCKYKASLPNFSHLVHHENVRWHTSMQREGINRPKNYRPREVIQQDAIRAQEKRAERERMREEKKEAKKAAAQRRRQARAAASAIKKQVAEEQRREQAARDRGLQRATAEHERKLRTLTGIRLQMYLKDIQQPFTTNCVLDSAVQRREPDVRAVSTYSL